MAQAVIQTAFHSGEWAPALYARVDLQKYHSAAALLRNFFVDYRGGVSTRPGTRYALQAYRSATDIRLIRFQASAEVNYVLEFGEGYVRFFSDGGPVLEAAKTITGATKANPAVITAVAHGFQTDDWVFISSVGGMTQLNNRYFRITRLTADTFSLQAILDSSNINSTAYTTYTSGGSAQRVYTLPSPYAAEDLALLKFVQSVNKMVFTHPDYVPYELIIISATSWTLTPIVFGSTVTTPTGVAAATSSAGALNLSFLVTAVDANGQESATSAVVTTTVNAAGATVVVSWSAVSGALSYNVYGTSASAAGVVPTGSAFGFLTNVTGVSAAIIIQANGVYGTLAPDFTQSIPVVKNPFQGAGVASATVTTAGSYTSVPSVTFGAAPAGGATATGSAVLHVTAAAISDPGENFLVGDLVSFSNGVVLVVATIGGSGEITAFQGLDYPGSNRGAVTSGSTPTNPVTGTNGAGRTCTVNFTWGVASIVMTSHGAGYTSVPTVTFSSGTAAATAVLEATAVGNPTVPGYCFQRLWLAAKPSAVQSFDASQPGLDYNFNVSVPLQPDDAISGSLKSQQLNTIRAMIPMSAGLIMFADAAAWLVNGGSAGAPVAADEIAANSQGYNGVSNVPPIVANQDILYVQAKGSIVRNLTYNYYTNIYTGTDITILSSHLFYGKQILEWSYQEEPFKLIHCVRDDGDLLVLTFLKEQELIGWTHYDTDGEFVSTASVTEEVSFGFVDATYVCVERVINGNTVKYIERFVERIFPNGVEDAWCVDAGVQYDGVPATTFSGGDHLVGETVTGLADGAVITPFVMPASGTFTLAEAASKVTVGIGYTCQLQTLPIDVGQPTVQSKDKQISKVTLRVADTLGLKEGRTFSTLVTMKDLVVGNVGSMTNEVVTDLVTGDARTIIDAAWTTDGQYCVQQDQPFPATILGVIPHLETGR